MKKSTARLALSILVPVIIFTIIFRTLDFRDVVSTLFNASPVYLLLALLLTFLQLPVLTGRWQSILHSMGRRIPFMTCLRLLLAAQPMSSVTPSKSGDIARAVYLRDRVPVSEGLGSLLTEKILDILLLLSLASAGLLLLRSSLAYLAGGLELCIVSFLLIFAVRRAGNEKERISREHTPYFSMREKIRNLMLASRTLIKNKKLLSLAVFYTVLFWALSFAQTQMIMYAVGVSIPFQTVATHISIAILVGLLPVTISGMGTRDTAILFLFGQYGEASQLLSAAILFLIYRYWLVSLLGLPFLYKMHSGSFAINK